MGAVSVLSSSPGGRVDSGALHVLPASEEEQTVFLLTEKTKSVCGLRMEEAAFLEFLWEDRREFVLWITSQEVPQRDPVLDPLKDTRKCLQEKQSALDLDQAQKTHPSR